MSTRFADIERAAAYLHGRAVETPLLESAALNAACGRRVLAKAESLQRTGSFKYRGASWRIACLAEDERARGVIAFSSGNFAQGLAAAGREAGVAVTIVMPADAPPAKIEATRGYGARVVLSEHGDRNREEAANELASELAARDGLTRLHPFDDPMIVAGQGTLGLELAAQLRAAGVAAQAVAVPAGGGGLVAGVALAMHELAPGTRVHSVEPEGYDDLARSLASGTRERVVGAPRSACDALQAAMPGAVPFAVAQPLLAGGIAVSDAEVAVAMRRAFVDLKLVLEPSGAVALAALLARRMPGEGPAVAILSGGNVALDAFARLTR